MNHNDIPIGTHACRAVHAEACTSKSGTPGIKVILVLPDYGNAELHWTGWLTPKSVERTFQQLAHLGWDRSSLDELAGVGSVDARVEVREEEYEGRVSKRAAWILGPQASAASGLDALFGAQLRAFRAEAPAAPVAPAEDGPRPGDAF